MPTPVSNLPLVIVILLVLAEMEVKLLADSIPIVLELTRILPPSPISRPTFHG